MTNRKWPRSDEDVRRLASFWGSRWTPADGIEPWLRRHLDEMTRMVRAERWRWEDIAHALNLAGISYAAGRGRPWTAALLMDKAAKLRGQRRRRLADRVASGQGEATISVEMLREALSKIGVVHQLVVNLPGAAPASPAASGESVLSSNPASTPVARPVVRPARGVTPAASEAAPAVPPLARPVAPSPSASPAFEPEEDGRNQVSPEADVQPGFKAATLKGRSRKPSGDGETK